MGLVRATATGFRKAFVLSGRATWPDYWWFVLASALSGIGGALIDMALLGGTLDEAGPIETLTALAFVIPTFTVGIRRLHDTGRSGWWFLVAVACLPGGIAVGAVLGPVLGQLGSILAGVVIALGFLLPIWWFVLPSQPGRNRYGPDPHGGGSDIDAPA